MKKLLLITLLTLGIIINPVLSHGGGGDRTCTKTVTEIVTTTSTYCPTPEQSLNENENELDKIGSDPCTWGPAYWCSSKDNAIKCGTEIWCERHNRSPWVVD